MPTNSATRTRKSPPRGSKPAKAKAFKIPGTWPPKPKPKRDPNTNELILLTPEERLLHGIFGTQIFPENKLIMPPVAGQVLKVTDV